MKKHLRRKEPLPDPAAEDRRRNQRMRWAAEIAAAPKLDLVGRDINRCSSEDPVVVPKVAFSRDAPDAPRHGPAWSPVSEWGTSKKLKPHIRCICGDWSGIGLHHVHADGRVTASFFHATAEQLAAMGDGGKRFTAGCGWHVFIKLDGYDDYGDYPASAK